MAASERKAVVHARELFQKQKDSSLSGIDYSKKGSIDKPIVDLVGFINGLENFFTTSSCSGRIAIISEVSFWPTCSTWPSLYCSTANPGR